MSANHELKSPESAVSVHEDGPVWTVVVDRPAQRNAIDLHTAAALYAAFDRFDRSDEARVAVLWGAGGQFCAGADLKAIAAGMPNRLQPDGPGPLGPTRMELSKPVIAAVAGYAVAGGMELALWCDLRVVEEDVVFGVFCRRFGVPLIDGGTVRLPRLIGLSRAMDLILTGRPVSADEALQIGLANRVVPRGRGRQEAEALARQLAEFPQRCLRADRKSARGQFEFDQSEALRREFDGALGVLAAESTVGAARFSDGLGRHGSPLEPAVPDSSERTDSEAQP